MNRLEIEAPAKINLTLDILRKREDGYHDMSMIMQSISLKDHIRLKEREQGIHVECTDPRIPCDGNNLVHKAAVVLSQWASLQKGVVISIEKKIPLEAGLAGGSTDAAAVLKGLAQLWQVEIPLETLMELGNRIGADVPFCLMGGTALAEGTGNRLTPLPDLPKYHVVLVKPEFGVSTQWAFSKVIPQNIVVHPDNKGLCRALAAGRRKDFETGLVNVFEPILFREYPLLTEIKEGLLKAGAQASLMSGSGPTMYGLFRDKEQALRGYEVFQTRFAETYLAETCSG